MELNVIGCYGPVSSKEGPTSSYLIKTNEKNILLDIGAGSLVNLQKVINIDDIDLIILSHLHSDHMNDLNILRYYLENTGKKMDILLPNEPEKEYLEIASLDCFNTGVITDNMILNIEGIEFSFLSGDHPYKSYMTKISSEGKTFVYSGDTCLCDNLKVFLEGADYALLDGAFTEEHKGNPKAHMLASECAKVCEEVGVGKLMITHLSPFVDRKEYLLDAKKGSNLEATLAVPLVKVEI